MLQYTDKFRPAGVLLSLLKIHDFRFYASEDLFYRLHRDILELHHEVKQMALVPVAFQLHFHRHDVVVSGGGVLALHLIGVDDDFLLTQPLEDTLDVGLFGSTERHVDVACAEVLQDEVKGFQAEQDKHGRGDGQYVHARTGRHADGRGHPEACRRREAAYHVLLEDDRSGTDESDAYL